MATTIDELQLEIKSNSSNASNEIDRLATSLSKLKNVGKLTTVVNNLSKLNTALNGLNVSTSGLSNLNKIQTALSGLSSVNAKGFTSTINALKKIPDITKSLNSNTLIKFDKELKVLANSLNRVAPQMSVVVSAFNLLNRGVKNASNSFGKLNTKVKENASGMSLLYKAWNFGKFVIMARYACRGFDLRCG